MVFDAKILTNSDSDVGSCDNGAAKKYCNSQQLADDVAIPVASLLNYIRQPLF